MSRPTVAEIRQLVHALREPVGVFAVYLSLLDDDEVDDEGRNHLAAMLVSVMRMTEALNEITSRFGLEMGDATPLSMIDRENRRVDDPSPRQARADRAGVNSEIRR